MVRALICTEEKVADPPYSNGVPQPACIFTLSAAVGVHLDNARADPFFLDAAIATRADRDIQLATRRERYRSGQMPATILVVEAVVRKRGEYLRSVIAGCGFASGKTPTCK